MSSKLEERLKDMRLCVDPITKEIGIGVVKDNLGEYVDMECSRNLDKQELCCYFELFLKLFLDDREDCWFVNKTDRIKYHIKREKVD